MSVMLVPMRSNDGELLLSPDIASAAAQEFGHGYSNRQNGCSGQTAMFSAFWQEVLTKKSVASLHLHTSELQQVQMHEDNLSGSFVLDLSLRQ